MIVADKKSNFTFSLGQYTVPDDALNTIRMQAWNLLEKRGLPTKEDEAFRYFPIRSLNEVSFTVAKKQDYIDSSIIEPYVLPECKTSYLVFTDGYLNLPLSRLETLDKRIAIVSLNNAMRSYGHFLQKRFTKTLATETDPFALLNIALHPSGAFLYLPPNTILNPLQVLFVSTKQEKTLVLPRLQIFAGANSAANIHILHADAESVVNLPALDVALEEGANIQVEHVAKSKAQGWNLFSVRSSLKKSARFSHLQWKNGSGIMRSDTHVILQGEGANTDLKGIWMLREKAQAHAFVRVDHEAPHTQSMQLFKGVLSDLSQSSFEGKIYVKPEAQKTQAYQLNKNLLLSPHVIAHAKPNLEIFADDVKASHGATVAHLDDELLFYIKSRGITESQAKSLLVEGFCREILEVFSLSSLKSEALHAVHSYLS